MSTYEMLWDCQYCNTKKLLGKTHRFCPCCGAAQNADKRYFPPDAERVAVENHVFVGKDRACGRCKALMAANAQFCGSCGAGMDAAAKEVSLVDENAVRDPGLAPKRPSGRVDPTAPPPLAKAGMSPKLKLIIGGIVAVLVAVIGVFVLDGMLAKPITVKVKERTWERVIVVEQLKVERDGAWCDDKPSDAYDVSRSMKAKSVRMADGQTCRDVKSDSGDGTFKVSQKCETKYVDKQVQTAYCDFKVDRWRHARDVAMSSKKGDGPEPKWPDVQLPPARKRPGDERIASKKEIYEVAVTAQLAEGKPAEEKTCDVPLEAWKKLAPGENAASKKGGVFGGIDCKALASAATAGPADGTKTAR